VDADAPPGGAHDSSVGPFEPSVAAHRLPVGVHDCRVGVHDKNTSRANANKHARALAARIKAHPAYTVALGSLGMGCASSTSTLMPGTDGGILGKMDEVRFYNRALSTSEVHQLYVYESGPRVNLIKAVKPSFSNLTLTLPIAGFRRPEHMDQARLDVHSDQHQHDLPAVL